jgi:hypothetical protein
MPIITITLDDNRLTQLQDIAAQQGISVEAIVEAEIDSLIRQSSPSFQVAADYVLQKNTELYQRLAPCALTDEDYLKVRDELFEGQTVESLVAKIQAFREQPEAG